MAKTVSKPKGLDGLFERATGDLRPRLIMADFGEVGTIKTTFGLGMPGPLLVLDGDKGMGPIIQPFLDRGKEIYRVPFSSNISELREIKSDAEREAAAEEIATKVEDAYYSAIENGIRSVLIDKEGQFYDIVKYAMLGGQESDSPNRFYPINQRLAAMVEAAKESDINLMFIQGMTTPWGQELKNNGKIGGKELVGQRKRKGWKQLEEQVNLNVEHIMRIEDGSAEFYLKIGKVRGPGGRHLQYTEIPFSALEQEGDEEAGIYPFARFAMEVYPGTTEEDWQ